MKQHLITLLTFFTFAPLAHAMHSSKCRQHTMSFTHYYYKKQEAWLNCLRFIEAMKKKLDLKDISIDLQEANGKEYTMEGCAVARVQIKGQPNLKKIFTPGPSGRCMAIYDEPTSYVIIIDPDFFYAAPKDIQEFLIGHEIVHIYKKHHTSCMYDDAVLLDLENEIREAAKNNEMTTVLFLQEQQENLRKNSLLPTRRYCEFQADMISATKLTAIDTGIKAIQFFIKYAGIKMKAHPYLQHCEDRYSTHPNWHHRLAALMMLKGDINFDFDNQEKDFTPIQRTFIETCYKNASQNISLALTLENSEIFKSLPETIQKQLKADCAQAESTSPTKGQRVESKQEIKNNLQ
jgi:hypothetical protein